MDIKNLKSKIVSVFLISLVCCEICVGNVPVFALRTEEAKSPDQILEEWRISWEREHLSKMPQCEYDEKRQEARKQAEESVKKEYKKFLWKKDKSISNRYRSHADTLYKKLNLIAKCATRNKLVLKVGLFPGQYDDFCKNYICPQFFKEPKVISKSDFDKLDDQHLELFRGIHASARPELDRYFQEFKKGEFFIGSEKCGIYSTGNIELPRVAFAGKPDCYGRCDSKYAFGGVMRFCYKESDMKIICADDLREIVKTYFKTYRARIKVKTGVEKHIFNLLEDCFIIHDDNYHGPIASALLAQEGMAARILGFDVIKVDEGTTCLKTAVLNRSKIIVQDTFAETYENGTLVSF